MHKIDKAAKRYAKALIDLAQEKNLIDNVLSDMRLIRNTIEDSKELRFLLQSPIVKTDKKRTILDKIFEGRLSELTKIFIDLVLKQQREASLVTIPMQYEILYRKIKNITVATVTSAAPLSEEARKKIISIVESNQNTHLELEEKVDESLIGGYVLNINDLQLDSSVFSALKKLRMEFSDNDYVSEL